MKTAFFHSDSAQTAALSESNSKKKLAMHLDALPGQSGALGARVLYLAAMASVKDYVSVSAPLMIVWHCLETTTKWTLAMEEKEATLSVVGLLALLPAVPAFSPELLRIAAPILATTKRENVSATMAFIRTGRIGPHAAAAVATECSTGVKHTHAEKTITSKKSLAMFW